MLKKFIALFFALCISHSVYASALPLTSAGGGSDCIAIAAPSGGLWNATTFTGWTTNNVTISGAFNVSPACITDANTQVENTATSTHQLERNTGATMNAGAYTFTYWAKSITGTRNLRVQIYDNATFSNQVSFLSTLSDCTASAITVSGVFSGPAVTASDGGNRWCKYVLTFNITALATTFFVIHSMTNSGSVTYTGDGVSSISGWGYDFR